MSQYNKIPTYLGQSLTGHGRTQTGTRTSDSLTEDEKPSKDLIITTKDRLMKILATPFGTVYTVSDDRTTYTTPRTLCGTPVAKIKESDDYWVRGWKSLDQFLAKEAGEIKAKQDAHRMWDSDRTNKHLKAAYKLRSDNCSKHKKIREIFGPTTNYHPNQLVSKRHMCPGGLCDMETMYHVACKISDLQILKRKGELSMDPFDFIRWRISLQAVRKANIESSREMVKSIIHDLGSLRSESDVSADGMFRQIVLRAAAYDGRTSTFGSKKRSAIQNGTEGNRAGSGVPVRRPIVDFQPPVARNQGVEARRQSQKLRRAARPKTAGIYGGVNSFRAQRQPPPTS